MSIGSYWTIGPASLSLIFCLRMLETIARLNMNRSFIAFGMAHKTCVRWKMDMSFHKGQVNLVME